MAGHIRKRTRADGTVSYQARRPDPRRHGTAKVEKTFRTKVEAQRWLAEQEVAVAKGSYLDPRRLEAPFSEVVDLWRRTWAGRLQDNTEYGYEKALALYLLPAFGDMRVGAISRSVLTDYFAGLTKAGRLSPASIRKLHGVMRAALNEAVRLEYLHANPCTLIRLPRIPHKEMLYLTPEEAHELAERIEPHFRSLIYCAVYTGLRSGELCGLRRKDFDPIAGKLVVSHSLKDIDGELRLGPTKTHSVRTITLPPFLTEMLTQHVADTAHLGNAPGDPIFTNKAGGWLHHRNFYPRYFKRAVRDVLPTEKHGLRFHDLRHTCVAMLIALGAHPRAIQTRLGHTTIQMTMDRYGHLLPSLEEPLAGGLDAMYRANTT